MAITYEITRMSGPDVMGFAKRHRAPAAHDALWTSVHEMLAAQALLDRPIAYKLLQEVNAAEVSPPPRGHYRSQTFKLGGSYLDEVKLFVFRHA